jgi:transposase
VVTLGEIVMIHDLKRQGLSIAAIARTTGHDRKTVRKHLKRGLEAPVYGPRLLQPGLLEPFEDYLTERIRAHPGLSGKRLLRDIKALGYGGGYTTVTDFLRTVRPDPFPGFEVRFETPPGRQAQVDFAQFRVEFSDEPGVLRILWLFTMVLGHSRWLWGRFCIAQDQGTVLRCHIDAFAAMGASPREVLYDRMKTAVIGQSDDGVVQYNSSLVALLRHYDVLPRACKPYRAKTKGKVERPFRYIRQDFFLGRSFRNLDDLNQQFGLWRHEIANARRHATTNRIVHEAFAAEQPALTPLPRQPYNAVLTLERRVSHDGMISFGGNLYSVPDSTRKRVLDIQCHPQELRIYETGVEIARHRLLEGRNQRSLDPRHRKLKPVAASEAKSNTASAQHVVTRSLEVYGLIGQRLAGLSQGGQ